MIINDNNLKKKQLIAYLSFVLIFLLLVIIAISRPKVGSKYDPEIFGSIAWYAVFIMSGICFAVTLGLLEIKRFNKDPNLIYDGLLIFVPLAIIGARIWYVLFNPGTPLIPSDFRLQGLAIHGAVIFTFVGIIFFAKYKKESYWFILDIVAPGFLIGQIMGRWGNFMNAELYGPAIKSQWLIDLIPGFIKTQVTFNGIVHHPTFLYESLLNLIGLITLLIIRRKRILKLGDMMTLYLSWYGIVRIPIELLRIASGNAEALGFGGVPIQNLSQWYLSVSVWTSISLIIAGVAIFILKRKFFKDLPYYADGDKKAVLFDFDGTLIDTKDLVVNSFKKTIKELMPQLELSEEEYLSFFGPTLVESFSRYEDDEAKVSELIKCYRKHSIALHQKGVNAFPHAKETITKLKQLGYLVGIVSSKKVDVIKLGLKQTGMSELFDVIIGAGDTSNHKPHPTPLLMALEKLGVYPQNSAYIGDHVNDIRCAKNAKVISVAVSYSPFYHQLLSENPDYVIDDLEKLLLIFK